MTGVEYCIVWAATFCTRSFVTEYPVNMALEELQNHWFRVGLFMCLASVRARCMTPTLCWMNEAWSRKPQTLASYRQFDRLSPCHVEDRQTSPPPSQPLTVLGPRDLRTLYNMKKGRPSFLSKGETFGMCKTLRLDSLLSGPGCVDTNTTMVGLSVSTFSLTASFVIHAFDKILWLV